MDLTSYLILSRNWFTHSSFLVDGNWELLQSFFTMQELLVKLRWLTRSPESKRQFITTSICNVGWRETVANTKQQIYSIKLQWQNTRAKASNFLSIYWEEWNRSFKKTKTQRLNVLDLSKGLKNGAGFCATTTERAGKDGFSPPLLQHSER